jgi:hypothetical protein
MNRQGAFEQSTGAVEVTLVAQDESEVDETVGRLQVVGA